MVQDGPLVVQHELRRAGRPRRGEDDAARFRRTRVGDRRPTLDQLAIAGCRAPEDARRDDLAARVIDDCVRERSERGRIALTEDAGEVDPAEARPEHDRLATGTSDDVGDLVRPEAGVHRDRDRAEPAAGEEDGEPRRQLRQPARHAVASADAERRKPTGKPCSLVGERPETDRTFAVEKRDGVRTRRGSLVEKGCERQAAHPSFRLRTAR